MNKNTLLQQIQTGLTSGTITPADINTLLNQAPAHQPAPKTLDKDHGKLKLNAVDAMFHIGGLILFISLMTLIGQSWDDGSWILHVALSAGTGFSFWAGAWILKQKASHDSDIAKGLTDALVLTGSLSVIAGGFIVTNELINGFSEINLIPGAITFIILSVILWLYDRAVRNTITIVLSIILGVIAFPTLMYGLVADLDSPADIYGVIVIVSGILLAATARFVAKADPSRAFLKNSFDSLAVTVALTTIFGLSFSDYGVIWQLILPIAIIGVFYASILRQSKDFLMTASFFLVVYSIYVSFYYLSDLGPVVGLLISALSIIGVAISASHVNRKYIK